MLRASAHPALVNADATALPVRDGAFDVQVQAVIDTEGDFRTASDVAAFVCR